jgi:hypothetical protein
MACDATLKTAFTRGGGPEDFLLTQQLDSNSGRLVLHDGVVVGSSKLSVPGTERTNPGFQMMSVVRGKPEVAFPGRQVAF